MVDTSQWQAPVGPAPSSLPPGFTAPGQMAGNAGAQQGWQPQAGMPDWLVDAWENGGGYTLTDDDLMMLANWLMTQQMGQEVANVDYQNRYLDFLNRQVGLSEQELDLAQQQVSFQQGDYWEWYVNDFFPAEQEKMALQLQTAQVQAQSQQEIAGYEQQRAKDYALSSAYQTEQARLGTEAARYQYLQSMNINPVKDAGSRTKYMGY